MVHPQHKRDSSPELPYGVDEDEVVDNQHGTNATEKSNMTPPIVDFTGENAREHYQIALDFVDKYGESTFTAQNLRTIRTSLKNVKECLIDERWEISNSKNCIWNAGISRRPKTKKLYYNVPFQSQIEFNRELNNMVLYGF